MDWQSLVINIPDYPKPGITFKDITPLLANGEGFYAAIEEMAQFVIQNNLNPHVIAGPEARGFIFGSALAQRLKIGLIPLRKPGKLPRPTKSISYGLEYGKDTLQIHKDDITPGMKVLMVDDILATGGTMGASIKLIEDLGAKVVGAEFLIELPSLNGRQHLNNIPINSLIISD